MCRRFVTIVLFLIGCIIQAVDGKDTPVNIPTQTPGKVERVAAFGVPRIARPFFVDYAGGIGRSQRRLEDHELAQCAYPLALTSGTELSSEEFGFDLWTSVEKLQLSSGTDLLVAFDIQVATTGDYWVGLGNNDEVVVYVNRQPVFGLVGSCEYVRNRNLFRVTLASGLNEIRVLCHHKMWKEVPLFHYYEQWMLSVDLFSDSTSAWDAFRRRNFHFLDTPIVRTIRDFRVDSVTPEINSVTLYNSSGNRITSGYITPTGIVSWNTTDNIPVPLLGFIDLAGRASEPIIIMGENSLQYFVDSLISRKKDSGNSAYASRIRHLLKPEFNHERTIWWARKLAAALAAIQEYDGNSALSSVLSTYALKDLRFVSYRSNIDGTIQYYQRYNNPRRAGKAVPIVIVLPTVSAPVRPYLESAELANLQDTEILMDLALDAGVDLIWPGIVDIDYGGNLARSVLDEVLIDIAESHEHLNVPVVLLATCSSGVLAIGYAKTREISGLILQTPMIHRGRYRWFNGIDVADPQLPSNVLEAEQTDADFDRLMRLPIFLTFNIDVPGHGDRLACRKLCAQLITTNTNFEQHWPKADREFRWGERLRVPLAEAFSWLSIKSKEIASKACIRVIRKRESVLTVKDCLLQGFSIEKSTDKLLAQWLERWSARWFSIRGTPSATCTSSLGSVNVTSDVLSEEDYTSIRNNLHFKGTCVYKRNSQSLKDNDKNLFGVRLLNGNTVQIFRSADLIEIPPAIDLIVDGCVRGALWQFDGTEWHLLEAWL
jgi:hypothetical protein